MKNVKGTLTSSQSNRMSPHMVNVEQLTKLFDKIVEVTATVVKVMECIAPAENVYQGIFGSLMGE